MAKILWFFKNLLNRDLVELAKVAAASKVCFLTGYIKKKM